MLLQRPKYEMLCNVCLLARKYLRRRDPLKPVAQCERLQRSPAC